MDPELRREHGEKIRAGLAEGRRLRAVQPRHIQAWQEAGQEADQLGPFVALYAPVRDQYAEDLGGYERLSEVQRTLLDDWFECKVAGAAEFAIYRRTASQRAFDRWIRANKEAAARAQMLGLRREERPVPGIDEYLAS